MTKLDSNRTLHGLLALTQRLTDDRPLEDFLSAVTDTARDLIGADHTSLRLFDASRSALLCGARSGNGSDDEPMTFRRGEGVLGWVVEHGASARIDDAALDPRFKSPERQSFAIRSVLAEPLWSSGEVIGVLSATSPEPAAFDEDNRLLLRLLANCSAPPIERARLRRLAMFDDTTLAFNHRYLLPRLVEEIDRAARMSGDVSLLLMDLDHFKQVNDQHGHKAGDVALRLFADRVRASVRRVDIFVRRGGEEFVLIMPGTGIEHAHATAKRIQQTLDSDALEVLPGVHVHQTVSIGVAAWRARLSAEDLEARADRAMYEAKRQGRNRVLISSEA